MAQKTVGILGCGWLGMALLQQLARQPERYRLRGSSRSAERLATITSLGAEAYPLDLPVHAGEGAFTRGLDTLIITLPPGGRRWKSETTERYLAALRPLADWNTDLHCIYTSSIGIYGDTEGEVDETTPPAPTTASGRAVLAAERWLRQTYAELTVLRLGGLVGPGRHPGRFFDGRDRKIPNGEAPVNLVTQAEAVAALAKAIQSTGLNVCNVVGEMHPPKGPYYGAAAASLNLPVPEWTPGGKGAKIVRSDRLRQRTNWAPEPNALKKFISASDFNDNPPS